MFNKDFYPTDRPVIERMLSGFDLRNKIIVEPQAGSGNIIDYLHEQGATVLACEIHPELAKIAASKADKFLGKDFLKIESHEISHVDYIVMNPPFSADEKHILHAYDIAPEGCTIISLCNSETLNNTYSRQRRSLYEYVKNNGKSEGLGECFSTSERKTNVDVSLITLFKPVINENFEFEGYFDLDENYEGSGENGLMSYNSIRDVVNRYVGSVKMFDEVQNKSDEINELMQPISSHSILFGAHNKHDNYQTITRDVFKKDLQKSAWRSIFAKMNMGKYLTKSVMEDINKFVEKQDNVPFTMNNIYKMIEVIVGTRGNRMKRVIVDVFDTLTKHHKENRFQKEGWKTNSEYRVNKKFIINWGMIEATYGGKMSYKYSESYTVDDLTKALCFITGENYNDMIGFQDFAMNIDESTISSQRNYKYRDFGTWYDFNFFEIKGFKKGTVHVKFKSEKIWNMFNQEACKEKGFVLASKFTSDFRSKGTDIVF